jgi:hypothetical protein
MEILIRILEDVGVIVLTIVILVGGLYLILLALQWGLRLKMGSREEEGLAELWNASLPGQRPVDENKTPDGDKLDGDRQDL